MRIQARRPSPALLGLLAFLAAALGTAILYGASLTACGALVGRWPLLVWGLLAGSGAIFAACGLFVALRRESVLLRSAVTLWAGAFYIAAFLALNYILSLFIHCPPN